MTRRRRFVALFSSAPDLEDDAAWRPRWGLRLQRRLHPRLRLRVCWRRLHFIRAARLFASYSARLAHTTFRYSIVYLALLFAALLVDHYFLIRF